MYSDGCPCVVYTGPCARSRVRWRARGSVEGKRGGYMSDSTRPSISPFAWTTLTFLFFFKIVIEADFKKACIIYSPSAIMRSSKRKVCYELLSRGIRILCRRLPGGYHVLLFVFFVAIYRHSIVKYYHRPIQLSAKSSSRFRT